MMTYVPEILVVSFIFCDHKVITASLCLFKTVADAVFRQVLFFFSFQEDQWLLHSVTQVGLAVTL